jgi:hypothetical protein
MLRVVRKSINRSCELFRSLGILNRYLYGQARFICGLHALILVDDLGRVQFQLKCERVRFASSLNAALEDLSHSSY